MGYFTASKLFWRDFILVWIVLLRYRGPIQGKCMDRCWIYFHGDFIQVYQYSYDGKKAGKNQNGLRELSEEGFSINPYEILESKLYNCDNPDRILIQWRKRQIIFYSNYRYTKLTTNKLSLAVCKNPRYGIKYIVYPELIFSIYMRRSDASK